MLAFLALAITSLTASAVRRLPPHAFTRVPAPVRRTLEAERCLIPQASASHGKNNVVHGHFRSHSRIDYAALCSRNGKSTVFVINPVTGAILARLYRQPDDEYVVGDIDPTNGEARHLYARRLSTVPPMPDGFCLEGLEEYLRCPCKGTSYDGIEDLFEGKASETHCWRNGWHTVTSGD
jgi:hypothetical protein